jgi:hypothetical protein
MLSDLFPFPLTSSRDNHNVFAQSIALGVSLSDKWGSYIEYFGLYTDGLAADFSQHFIDGGFTYLVNYNLQLDVRAGTGLNDASEDLFAGVGLSYRR